MCIRTHTHKAQPFVMFKVSERILISGSDWFCQTLSKIKCKVFYGKMETQFIYMLVKKLNCSSFYLMVTCHSTLLLFNSPA